MMGSFRKDDTDRKASRHDSTAYCGKGHHLQNIALIRPIEGDQRNPQCRYINYL